ncbi:MAG: class I SAM-dependent methyltransferase [Chloroflexi bacterium]|nr:class I SAM-dependent methyltransferase [Chloroflexota bacterium]
MSERIPLPEEPIADMEAVIQYDRGARYYIMPEYKYFVRKILKKGIRSGRVLDIGTGSGRLAIELAKVKDCHFDIIALDVSENMIRRARENARRCGVEKRITFMVATAAALPFADGSFDLVISYASLHHWFQPVTVFDEVARVTKDTGQAIIRDNKRVYQDPAWRGLIWMASRFMNKRHRENWPKAILASYTIPEVNDLLRRSQLRNYRVSSDFVLIDLCVEAPP